MRPRDTRPVQTPAWPRDPDPARRAPLAREIECVLPALVDLVVEPERAVIAAAARFKADRLEAGAKCSFVDAWGYATARDLGIPFLTGDEDFRGVPGVKFVKA